MNKIFTVLFVLVCLIENSVAKENRFHSPASYRVKYNIDFDWRFIRGDFPAEEETHQVNQLPWAKVNLPHDWTIEGPFDKEHNTTQGFLPMGIGWYKKDIFLPECYEDKNIFIIFDGVYRSSDVWMNYVHLGHHESGYTSFIYDLTDYVRFADPIPNGLRVRVDGRRHEQDMYEGNGIYRHVWLLITDKLYIPHWGTFVSTPAVSKSKATIEVKTKVKNEYEKLKKCKLTTQIVDIADNIITEMISVHKMPANSEYEFIQKTEIENPHLWSIDDPYLYTAHSIVEDEIEVVDTYETTFGIRYFSFDPDNGFFLNGEHVKLKGFNAHYDFAGLGTALPDRIHWNVMMAMKKAGFNFYRSSHNPATHERLDVCDQIGMMVWDEIERKLESIEIELRLVRETILRDRNHPSVILWSLENESPLESTNYGTKIIQAATELAHQLDPSRLTTFAASMSVNKKGYGEAIDVVSYNYHLQRADQDHLDFPHWKIGLISEYSAARARRGVYGIEDFPRAADDNYFDLYDGMVQSMYEMCHRVEDYWRRIKARDYLGGGCLWSGVDAWGEGNAWPLISRGDGALDLCLFPKDVYYYFVSQWTEEPMVHIFPHWNWEGKEDQLIDVWGYSNCDSVELFLNGRSLETQIKPPEPMPWSPQMKEKNSLTKSETAVEHLAWKVPYEPGIIRAVGMQNDKIVCSHEVQTAGKPARIKLSLMMESFLKPEEVPPLIANGRDVMVIKAVVFDENDILVPTADHLINFDIEGEGKIIGVGNGDIVSHEPNKVTYRRAYNGLCAAIVQSTITPDQLMIKATSPDLVPDRLTITSMPPDPTQIAVLAEPHSIPSINGTATITAEIRDEYGVIIPSATNEVTFELKGPAIFENGKTICTLKANHGKVNVKLKPEQRAGIVKISVYSEELIPAKIEVIIK